MPFSLSQFYQAYETEILPVKIEQRTLKFLKPKNIQPFINADNPLNDFPLWAKFWEASTVLTQYLATLPNDPHRNILELGSGLGIAGIVAAVLGHKITLTEHNPDALQFLHANACLNGCPNLPIHALDWFKPHLSEHFDLIVGSEIIYQDQAVDALSSLFEHYLNPNGKIVLAERVRSTGILFFERLSSKYYIQVQKHVVRSEEKNEIVILFNMTAK
jgi:predicted nicotinamide N-methyase